MKNNIVSIIDDYRDDLVKDISNKLFKDRPGLVELYDDTQKEKTIQDIRYHLSYLREAISFNQESLFFGYIRWLWDILNNLNIKFDDYKSSIDSVRSVLSGYINNTSDKEYLNNFINGCIKKLEDYDTLNNKDIKEKPVKYEGLRDDYIKHLLDGDKQHASKIILNAVKDNNIDIKDLYIYVFQESLIRIGKMWELNKISVAQEHFFTASTQLIISQLYPYIFSTGRNNIAVVSASISGELHEVGARMVSDFLEMDGFDTFYLGSNVPVQDILKYIEKVKAGILGVSCTMAFHLSKLITLIKEIKTSETFKNVKVIVGGNVFNRNLDLWKKLNADGYSKSALDTPILVESLL